MQSSGDKTAAADSLSCIHFGPCSGCSLDQGLWSPPILSKAQQFFASHGVTDFQVQQGKHPPPSRQAGPRNTQGP
jgi:hypothetical protein